MLHLIVKLMRLLPDMQRLKPLFKFKVVIFLPCSLWRKLLSTVAQPNVRYFQRVTFAAHALPAIKMSCPPLDPLYCGAHTPLVWHRLMIASVQRQGLGQTDCSSLAKWSEAREHNKAAPTDTKTVCTLDFTDLWNVFGLPISVQVLKITSHQVWKDMAIWLGFHQG